MADNRSNPDVERNAGKNEGDEGGMNRRSPGRNPNEDQSTRHRGDKDSGPTDREPKDRGQGEQGGFEKGGQGDRNR